MTLKIHFTRYIIGNITDEEDFSIGKIMKKLEKEEKTCHFLFCMVQ